MLTVLLLLGLGLTLWAIVVFNRLVRARNQVRTAWADIDVQLTRRHDLVPQLVAAVQGYAAHERTLLATVTELRAQATGAAAATGRGTTGRGATGRGASGTGAAVLGTVETALEQALTRVFALQEAYPELKADQTFAQLQRDLVAVEEHLQFARRFYNGAVRDNNDAVQRVPDLLIARGFGFGSAEFFQADAMARPAITMELS